jgi:hypothetical protein
MMMHDIWMGREVDDDDDVGAEWLYERMYGMWLVQMMMTVSKIDFWLF